MPDGHKKAFDTVWQEGLFLKRFRYGITWETRRIIMEQFRRFHCYMRVSGGLSESINVPGCSIVNDTLCSVYKGPGRRVIWKIRSH